MVHAHAVMVLLYDLFGTMACLPFCSLLEGFARHDQGRHAPFVVLETVAACAPMLWDLGGLGVLSTQPASMS